MVGIIVSSVSSLCVPQPQTTSKNCVTAAASSGILLHLGKCQNFKTKKNPHLQKMFFILFIYFFLYDFCHVLLFIILQKAARSL